MIGPGSLYTSIIPNFLVGGIADAVRQSRALKIYVLNIMTQDGETDGYDADDHVRAILEHAGPGIMDVCIANDEPVPPEIMEPYAKEGVSQLELRREGIWNRWGLPCARSRFWSQDVISAITLTLWRVRFCLYGVNLEPEEQEEVNAVMSFSSNVKQELCRLPINRKMEAAAELYGILLYCNAFTSEFVRITTESRDLAERLPRLMKKVFGFSFDQEPEEDTGKLLFVMESQGKIHKMFAQFGLSAARDVTLHVNYGMLEEDEERLAFLRGAFFVRWVCYRSCKAVSSGTDDLPL